MREEEAEETGCIAAPKGCQIKITGPDVRSGLIAQRQNG